MRDLLMGTHRDSACGMLLPLSHVQCLLLTSCICCGNSTTLHVCVPAGLWVRHKVPLVTRALLLARMRAGASQPKHNGECCACPVPPPPPPPQPPAPPATPQFTGGCFCRYPDHPGVCATMHYDPLKSHSVLALEPLTIDAC